MDDLYSFGVIAIVAVIPIALGVVGALRVRHSWDAEPTRRAMSLAVRMAIIDGAVVLSVVPELATYPIYHHSLQHAPLLARLFAIFAALFSLGFVLPLAIPLVRRNAGARRARILGVLSIGLALLPLPLHRLTLTLVERFFGIHFFWR